ncbi:MAG TPA: tetratricopeptide repeat protein [Bryobacteraceae bacterium]|jgi:serine/threonine-protein kinase
MDQRMTARWAVVEQLFHEAVELPPEARAAFLEKACAEDQDLYREVESLLACSDATLSALAEPVNAIAGEMIGNGPEGRRIGPYRLIRLLGRGGMGVVFLAERADGQFTQQVAIKLMNAMLGTSSAMLMRFRAERQILARLTHPNIARLLDGGVTADGQSYLVMEYVEGEILSEYCRRVQPTLNARLQLFLQICDAVEYAHRYLVVHRDLKPANILVTATGTPKLLDFGVARLLDPSMLGLSAAHTSASERLLTPEYASPEQIRGEAITTATDVFGLGILLYELLAGRRPFAVENPNPMALARAVCEDEPAPPGSITKGIPRDLDHIALMALRKEPERRYVTAAQLSGDTRAFLNGLPVAARAGTVRYRSAKFVSRHKTAVAAAIIFFLTLACFSGAMAMLARRADRARTAAQREADFLSNAFLASTPEEAAGRTVTARELLDGGAGRIDRDLAGSPEIRAQFLQKIGMAYRRLGVHDKALDFSQRALDLKRRLYGPQNLETATALDALGEVYRDGGNFARAEPLLDRALTIRETELGADNPLIAESLANLGECLYLEDKDAEAEGLLRKSIALYRRLRNSDVVAPDNYLAQVLERKGSETEAIELLRESAAVTRQKYGAVSRDYANSLHNLGGALIKVGAFVEAERMTRDAAEIRRKILAPDQDRLYSVNNLTYIAVEEGNAVAAEPYSREALAMVMRLYGETHPRVAVVYRNQGRVRELRGNYTGAEASYGKALDILNRLRQPHGSTAATVLLSYAQLRLDRGDFAGAESDAREALQISEKIDSPNGPSAANALVEIALARELAGDDAAAEPLFRRALDIRRARAGLQAPVTISAQVRLGEALAAEGKNAEAEPLLRTADASVHDSKFTLLPWQVAEADGALAAYLAARGRLDQAKVLLHAEPANYPQAWQNRIASARSEKLRKSQAGD